MLSGSKHKHTHTHTQNSVHLALEKKIFPPSYSPRLLVLWNILFPPSDDQCIILIIFGISCPILDMLQFEKDTDIYLDREE